MRRPGEGGSTAHFSSETLVVLSSRLALRRKLAYTRESSSYNLARTRLAAGLQRSSSRIPFPLRYSHRYRHPDAPSTLPRRDRTLRTFRERTNRAINQASGRSGEQLTGVLNSKGVSRLLNGRYWRLKGADAGGKSRQRRGSFGITGSRRRTCSHMFRFKFPAAAPGVESLNLWGRAFRVRPGTHTHTPVHTRAHRRLTAAEHTCVFSPAPKPESGGVASM